MVHQYFLKLGTLLKALKVYRLDFFHISAVICFGDTRLNCFLTHFN
jgi:hypothetical protein